MGVPFPIAQQKMQPKVEARGSGRTSFRKTCDLNRNSQRHWMPEELLHLRVVRLALAAFLDGHATFEHAFLAAPVQNGAVHAAGA
jgi:hypothetical protein